MKTFQNLSPNDEAIPTDQFFIAATDSLLERRPRTLKHGDSFAVFDHKGDVREGPGSPEGFYHRDTRYLSHFFLTIEGVKPLLLSSILRDDNVGLTCDLTNPDLYDPVGNLRMGHGLIHIRRSRFIWDATCFERMMLRNFDDVPHDVRLSFTFAADFVD